MVFNKCKFHDQIIVNNMSALPHNLDPSLLSVNPIFCNDHNVMLIFNTLVVATTQNNTSVKLFLSYM